MKRLVYSIDDDVYYMETRKYDKNGEECWESIEEFDHLETAIKSMADEDTGLVLVATTIRK